MLNTKNFARVIGLLVIAFSAPQVFALTPLEMQQRKLVTRYYQLIQGMELSCTKADVAKQADYSNLLQRWQQSQPEFIAALKNSPYYSAVVQDQEPRLQANAQKNNAEDKAEACDYSAQLMTALLDTEAGKQALQEDLKTLSAKP